MMSLFKWTSAPPLCLSLALPCDLQNVGARWRGHWLACGCFSGQGVTQQPSRFRQWLENKRQAVPHGMLPLSILVFPSVKGACGVLRTLDQGSPR